jgi:hypothetical protein
MLRDQFVLKPVSNAPLKNTGIFGYCTNTLGIKFRQGLVYIPDAGQIGFVNDVCILTQELPESETNHLELDRLHIQARLLDHRPVWLLYLDSPQVIDQSFGRFVGKGDTLPLGGLLHCLPGCFLAQ